LKFQKGHYRSDRIQVQENMACVDLLRARLQPLYTSVILIARVLMKPEGALPEPELQEVDLACLKLRF